MELNVVVYFKPGEWMRIMYYSKGNRQKTTTTTTTTRIRVLLPGRSLPITSSGCSNTGGTRKDSWELKTS